MSKIYTSLKKHWLATTSLLMLLLTITKPIVFAQTVPVQQLEDVCGSFSVEHRNYVDADGNNVTISMSVGDTGQVNHDNWWYRIAKVDATGIKEKIWESLVEPAQAMHSLLAKPGEKFLLTFFVPTDTGLYEAVNCGIFSFENPRGESDFTALEDMLGIQQDPPVAPRPTNDDANASAQNERAFMPLAIENGGFRDDGQ